ncbi:hypothetical protein BCV72DRAFT_213348, partial [Rhizopus microsporus var. microsporus]
PSLQMTIQVRSKRRILPKRSVIDIDFVSSKSNNLQDLLCTSTQIPSKKDYSVINELFGDQSKFPSQREHLPHIVLGTPKRSRLLQKQEDRENLVESQKIHENIPVKSNDQENQDEKHVVGQGVLEKTKGLSNGKRNVLSENVIKTSTSTSSVSSSTSTSSDSKEPVVVIELTKRKKKLKVKELNPCERKESFMFPPKKEPKIKARHELLKTLKGSGALDWIINGRDRDSRKEDIGKVRKRQLERRLQRPFVTRKLIHNKNGWLIKQ